MRIGDGAHLTSFSASTTSVVLSNGNVVVAWQDQGFNSYATSVDGTLGGVFFKVFAEDGSVVQGNHDALLQQRPPERT